MSFKHETRGNDTELSKYLWELKEKKKKFAVSWKILAKARTYSNQSKQCNLCLHEKFFIISHPQMATMNKRNELVSSCRHRWKYILRYNWIVNQTTNHKRAHVIFEFSNALWAAQTKKHLLRTQNVSEQNQKHFLCPELKICARHKCCARGQRGKHLCRQQCVRNNVSSFARAFTLVLTDKQCRVMMLINDVSLNDASVCMELNWWVDQRLLV